MNEKDFQYINEAQLKDNHKGFMLDAIKDVADVDVKGIQRDFKKLGKNSDADDVVDKFDRAAGKMSAIATKGLGPAGDTARELDRMLGKTRVDNRSIFARAKNSVMQFPCYITQTIPVNAAHIISKSFERVYASFVQAAISQTKIIDASEANDLLFLKRFHTNIRESVDVMYGGFYEPIDEFDAMMKEAVFHREQISPTMIVEFRHVPAEASEYLVKESVRLSADPLEGFSYLKEADNNDKKNDEPQGYILKRKAEREKRAFDAAHNREVMGGTERNETILTREDEVNLVNDRIGTVLTDNDIKALKRGEQLVKAKQKAYEKELEKIKDEIRNGKRPGYKLNSDGQIIRFTTKKSDSSRLVMATAPAVVRGPETAVLLKDNEIRKINAMAPYMIECHFIIRENGRLDQEAHYLIGVKTIMHLIRPQDLAEDLRDIVTGKIKSLQKVKYKTGETSWWEYIFHKKQIKKDAGKIINSNKRWLNTLKRLSEFDKTKGSLMRGPIAGLNKGEIPIPNATLILSQPDVTMLTNQTGIDLSVVSNAVRLARALYLICVTIVDSSAGTMRYIFPDSMADWDVQSLSSIDAEVAKTDNSQLMRELNHLVNK